MTDITTAFYNDGSKLTPYEDRQVLRTSIAVRNAGDGLSEALGIEPMEMEIGTRVQVVLDCVVAGHNYVPIKDTEALELKQVLKAETATIMDNVTVSKALERQRKKIDKAREDAKGITRLPGTDSEDGEEDDEL